jgi:hypothetical protein
LQVGETSSCYNMGDVIDGPRRQVYSHTGNGRYNLHIGTHIFRTQIGKEDIID